MSWAAALRAARAPLPAPALDAAEEIQLRILGGSLIRWLQREGPLILAEREGGDPEPVIVFLTGFPGLVAAEQILGADHERVVPIDADRWEAFVEAHPDPTRAHHVLVWSEIDDELPDDLLARARAEFPLAEGEVYWLHHEGTEWAEHAARGAHHLWAWDGSEARLVQEAFQSWTS